VLVKIKSIKNLEKIKMTKTKSRTFKRTLLSLLAASALAGGCATPNSIKERRYLGEQGKLDNDTYTRVTANERGAMVRAGITVKFNNLKELREGTASALTAFGYGFFRPFYGEFWRPSQPGKLEYSGLAILNKAGYKEGMQAQTVGEWTRYIALIAGGILASRGSNGGSDNDAAIPASDYSSGYNGSSSGNTPYTPPIPPTPPTPPAQGDGTGGPAGN